MTTDNLCLNCLEPSSTQPCPGCGWGSGDEPDNPSALPPGTLLNKRFRLAKSLGQGGFGITYLAFDETLEIRLAVKEYLPQDFALRSHDAQTVLPKSRNEENFNFGLERFVKEARMLARFINHPGIVGVRDFFKENSTAYLVMDYVEGRSLKVYLAENEGQLPWDEAVGIMIPVLDALRAVHQEIDTDGEPMLHRDIAPDNIYITKDLRVELLDFGAARYASGEHSRSLSVVLKEGYAPEEQYRRKGKQGPWTDVYSCGATLYRMVTGELPDNALDRLEDDELRTPSELGIEIPHESEEALMMALKVRRRDRMQSVEELIEVLKPNGESEKPSVDVSEKLEPTPITVEENTNTGLVEKPNYTENKPSQSQKQHTKFKDLDGLTKWAKRFLFLNVILSVFAVVFGILEYQLLLDYKNGFYKSAELANAAGEASDARTSTLGIIQIITFILSGIIILKWIYRANYNARQLGAKGMVFTSGWSIGWYFIPIANMWKPYQAMKEIWKTSSNPQEWKNQSVSWLLPWWWFFWIVSNFTGNASLRMAIKVDDLNDYFNLNLVTQFSEITSLAMTLIFIAIISRVHIMQIYRTKF